MEKNGKNVYWFTHSETHNGKTAWIVFRIKSVVFTEAGWDMLEPNCRYLTSISWNVSWWTICYRIFLQAITQSQICVGPSCGLWWDNPHLKSFNKPHTHKTIFLSVDSLFYTTPSRESCCGCFDCMCFCGWECVICHVCVSAPVKCVRPSSFSPYTPSFW